MFAQDTGTATLDLDLARRAERKLRRYGTSLNGVMAAIVSRRRLVNAPLLPVPADFPKTIDFTVQGRSFTADVRADPWGGFTAQVRGHEDCFTDGRTIDELRAALVEVVELMVFDMGEEVHE